MLAIRMQRTGRKGHAMFRVIVQDSRRTPTSGKIVARLGSYDPHAKTLTLDKEKAGFYLEHGAQPSDRIARLLKQEGVKLPDWVQVSADKERTVRNADKRRSTRPPEPVAEETPAPEEEKAGEVPAETTKPTEEAPAEPAAESETGEEAASETPAAEAEAASDPAPETDAPETPAEETGAEAEATPETPAEETSDEAATEDTE